MTTIEKFFSKVRAIRWLLTHNFFHQDELGCFMLFLEYGDARVPGISQSKALLVDNPNRVTAEDLRALDVPELTEVLGNLTGVLTEEQLWDLGILPFAVIRGMLDDHGLRGNPTSAFEVVAHFLGVAGKKEVERLGQYMNHCDNTRDVNPFELPNLIKMMWLERKDPMEIIRSFMPLYRMILRQGQSFQDEWQRFDGENHEKQAFKVPGHKDATVSWGFFDVPDWDSPDDRPYILNVVRQKGFGLIIVRTKSGNVGIFTNDYYDIVPGDDDWKLDISGLKPMIRRKELEKAGKPHEHLSDEYLSQPEIPEDPYWYFPQYGEQLPSMLLDGSRQAARGIPATAITREEFVEMLPKGCRAVIPPRVVVEEYAVVGIVGKPAERPQMQIDLRIQD